MAFGNISGRARTNPKSPQAFGVCDDCSEWYNLDVLVKQYEWFGPTLQWDGTLVCPRCNDTPQDQLRPVILPPDPVPRINPRPENFITEIGLQGFTQYELVPALQTQAQVLAQVATNSGIPTPGVLTNHAGTITAANVSQVMIPANPARTWLLFYNPSVPQFQAALAASTVLGLRTNLNVGVGEAYFWSTSQGYGAVYTGALAIIGLIPGIPFFCWDAS